MKITATVTLNYDSEVSDTDDLTPEQFREQVRAWALEDFNGGVTFTDDLIEYK